MKREIKFRALYDGEWYYQEIEEILTIRLAAFILGGHKSQYTGLKDKNGKEIYEGDVLAAMSENIGSMEVRFEDGSFVGYNKHGRWGLLSRCFDADIAKIYKIEVIGNLYETPELLK